MDYDKRIEPTFGKTKAEQHIDQNSTDDVAGFRPNTNDRVLGPEIINEPPSADIKKRKYIIFALVIAFVAPAIISFIKNELGIPDLSNFVAAAISHPSIFIHEFFLKNVIQGIILLVISVLLSAVVIVASIPFKLGKSPRFRYSTFLIITLIVSLMVVIGAFSGTGVSDLTSTANFTASIKAQSKNWQSTPKPEVYTSAPQAADGAIEYRISDEVLRLEAEAKKLPRVPFVANLYAYQRVKNELESEFAQTINQKGSKADGSAQISAYQSKVTLKLAIYEAKIQEYSNLMNRAVALVKDYLAGKSVHKTIADSCAQLGVDMHDLFVQVDRIDAPAEKEAERVLALVFGPVAHKFRKGLVDNPQNLNAVAAAKDTIFRALRSAANNSMSDKEICQAYLNNNLKRPERKAFITKFPERYQALRSFQ